MIHQVDYHYKMIMEVDYSVVYHHVSHFTHDWVIQCEPPIFDHRGGQNPIKYPIKHAHKKVG